VKVLHVIDSLGLGGGAEHSLAALLPRLADRGVDSSVACLIPRQGGLQEALRRRGYEVTVLGPRSLPGRVRALRAHLRRLRPDLVHASLFQSCLVTRLATVGLGMTRLDSLVNTPYEPVRVEQLSVAPWKLGVVRRVDAWTARHLGGHFHAVSGAVADAAVRDLSLSWERITMIPRGRPEVEGADPPSAADRRATRTGLGLDPEAPLLINVGRQDPQKGQAILIRAWPAVRAAHPGATLLLAGREGGASAEVRRALEEVGVGSGVRLLGHRDDVGALLDAADLFVFPSFYEGSAGAVIEAMARRLAVVASDIPPLREVLGEGEGGVLVPPGDGAALAAAVVRLLDDPTARRTLGAAGRRRFEERYTLAVVADRTVDLYRRLLEGR